MDQGSEGSKQNRTMPKRGVFGDDVTVELNYKQSLATIYRYDPQKTSDLLGLSHGIVDVSMASVLRSTVQCNKEPKPSVESSQRHLNEKNVVSIPLDITKSWVPAVSLLRDQTTVCTLN